MPGKYPVRLTVGGQVYEQSLTVPMDPRVTTAEDVLWEQFRLSLICCFDERYIRGIQDQVQAARKQIADRSAKADDELKKDLATFDKKTGGPRRPWRR